jgi:ATP-dependent RNA helicase SUPV3L1/SUV3
MWGEHAVGKLVKGSDPLKPTVQPFVDDEAGPDVAEKVARRLQHFIDRKIAALFEPLLALQADEALAGLARGFAFRMVEGFGIVPREGVADDVKSLDQDMRGALRKHGVRFGQFTVFLPALLKPAPTRLRLVLWGLYKGLDEFPESPPPGLVTIPTPVDAPEGYDSMAGYRVAGARAIRIDMLERLADQIRGEDTRSGFEAKADMLSITGTTLEQFAALMTGLGYKAERGERPKLRAPKAGEAAAAPEAEAQLPQPEASDLSEGPQAATDEVPAEGNAPDLPEMAEAPQPGEAAVAAPEAEAPDDTVETSADTAETDATQTEATEIPAEAAGEAAEMEVFYTFTWAPRRPGNRQGNRRGRDGAQQGAGERQGATERQGGKPQGKPGGRPQGKGKPRREGGGAPGGAGKAKFYEARPPKKEKKIDPDNPFAAALMGLKDRK